jgi:hypothetical protein
MRLSPRILLIPIVAVLATLMPAASPALAQSPTDPMEHAVCDQQVCASVTVESSTEIYIRARANVPAGTCGHFDATVAVSNDLIHTSSATICMTGPTWYSGVDVPASGPGTVKVWFVSSPETLGEPIVHF